MSDSGVGGSQPSEKKRFRRSRKDCLQRNFACKYCDKTYMSNAALYTHVKNKHDKIQGSEYHKNKQHSQLASDDNRQQHSILSTDKRGQQNKKQSFLTRQKIIRIQLPLPLQKLCFYLSRKYPQKHNFGSIYDLFQTFTGDQSTIFQPLMQYWADKQRPLSNRSQYSIDYTIGHKLSLCCMKFLVKFFYQLRLGLQKQSKSIQMPFKQNCSKLPNFFNELIINNHISLENKKQSEADNEQKLIVKILEYFGDWLYQERYTDYRVVPNY